MPRPQTAKPITAGTVSPINSAPPSATATQRHAAAHQRRGAKPFIQQIPAEARDRHPEGEAGERRRRRRGACAGVVTEVDPAPVTDRALRHHRQEAQSADQDHGARGQREPPPRLGTGRHVPQPRSDPQRGRPERNPDEQALQPVHEHIPCHASRLSPRLGADGAWSYIADESPAQGDEIVITRTSGFRKTTQWSSASKQSERKRPLQLRQHFWSSERQPEQLPPAEVTTPIFAMHPISVSARPISAAALAEDERRVHEGEVRECLREVAQLPVVVRVVFL